MKMQRLIFNAVYFPEPQLLMKLLIGSVLHFKSVTSKLGSNISLTLGAIKCFVTFSFQDAEMVFNRTLSHFNIHGHEESRDWQLVIPNA